MNLGSMADLAADITPEKRARIDAIKSEMVDAERGHELASLRKAQGMTQVQVAKAMGVTQGRISQIERGGVRLDIPREPRTIGKNDGGRHEKSA